MRSTNCACRRHAHGRHALEEEARSASVPPQAVREGEFDKLKAERDGLLDRLARLQAEFENARKRSAASSRSSASTRWPTR